MIIHFVNHIIHQSKNLNLLKRNTLSHTAYIYFQEVDNCIGCMVAPSDVKLLRRCDTIDSDQPQEENNQPQDSCVTCYCRPMWCITCMGKW